MQPEDRRAKGRYHFVVPSLPGWGYSSPPSLDTEFAVQDISYLVNGLMRGLGFGKYIAQGGDIGSMVSVDLAVRHKECTGESGRPSLLILVDPVFLVIITLLACESHPSRQCGMYIKR